MYHNDYKKIQLIIFISIFVVIACGAADRQLVSTNVSRTHAIYAMIAGGGITVMCDLIFGMVYKLLIIIQNNQDEVWAIIMLCAIMIAIAMGWDDVVHHVIRITPATTDAANSSMIATLAAIGGYAAALLLPEK